MLRDLLTADDLTRERIKYLLMKITQDLDGDKVLKETADEIHYWINKDNTHLFDAKVSRKISEFYLRIQGKDELMFLKSQGFEGLASILVQFPTLPSKLVVSKIKPSKSIHILLSGEGDPGIFPTIHVMWSKNDWIAMSGYCKISPNTNICKLLNALLEEAKHLWELAFGKII